jgi:Holliday junction resolvase-like predicted endonuclease
MAHAARLPAEKIAEHRPSGQRGEQHAYFYLRRPGYIMAAQNFRSPRRRNEIDLIGWMAMCFASSR